MRPWKDPNHSGEGNMTPWHKTLRFGVFRAKLTDSQEVSFQQSVISRQLHWARIPSVSKPHSPAEEWGNFFAVLAEKLWDNTKTAALGLLFPNEQVSTTLSFPPWQKIVSNLRSNKPAWLLFRKSTHACKVVWGYEGERGACFQKPGRKVFSSLCLLLLCLSEKLMPVVGGQGPLSWLCLYQWKNTHLASGPQSTVRLDHISEENLTYTEHINSAGGGDKAELRHLD